ncbi:ImcF-related family protein [Burkholderia ambifaria]|uniref:ImcF-related family protein n=1 Tax=Burkholderia ambifaria TaxID=152480 RepID=UPI001C9370D0|nr:ImcF-related family protein [Burkholderia ambifaria]MBY4765911.1 type VI secretion protein VasK [Burkholderia ambifaria]
MFIRTLLGYWVLVPAVTAVVALLAYFVGADLHPSPAFRVGVIIMAGLAVLAFHPLWVGAWQWAARHASARSASQYDRDPSARIGTRAEAQVDLGSYRARGLRETLRSRHGWRWRYRNHWVLVTGDEPIVDRLAPGLADAGYVVCGDTILIYARQAGNALDTGWLDQIRRMRRSRPVDAVVALMRNRASSRAPFDADELSQRLARQARALRWAAPVYLANVTDFGSESSAPNGTIGLTWSNARINAAEVDEHLTMLSHNLADAGVVALSKNVRDRYPAMLSHHLAHVRSALSELVLQTTRSSVWRQAVHGLLFAPLFNEQERVPSARGEPGDEQLPSGLPHRSVWQTVAAHSRNIRGRRVGFSFSTAAAWLTGILIGSWIIGTMVSGFSNRVVIQTAADTVAKLASVQDRTQAMISLDGFGKQIDTLEFRQRDGAPLRTRFGLNRDAALLDALWPSYAQAASRILVTPIRERLERRLHQLASLSDAEIASGGDAQVQAAYDTLSAYMMLARPDRAVATFLAPQLVATAVPARPTDSSLSGGAWEDLRRRTIAFFANHSAQDNSLAIAPDVGLVASTRQTIVSVRGIQSSSDAVYQQILDDATPKYPPVSLATLLGDTSGRGVFNTAATIPGVFTRAAWDDRISKAIDDASGQHSAAGDWVLSDAKAGNQASSTLKLELRQRYFDDYARAWAQFLNSVRWQPAPTMSATADQLTLLGDPQRSPLVALMNAIVYQAGTGANAQSLSDTLISKAQQLVGADEKDPSKQAKPQLAPLAAAFGPILRLTGSDLASGMPTNGKVATTQMAATGDLSLARYLERITAMRLKTSQIVSSPDPDAIARLAAQAVLQGKTSDIADSRDYASRVAASLGEQWSGFGALFRAPFDQSWQVIVQPAASSLNEMWRTAILADWNKTFGGRYPFADSDNDASLPEMARFMRPDSGVIAQFVTSQLAGVVERQGDRWVAAQGADSGALTIDPAFLTGLNKLTRTSTVLFPSGDARVRYELRAEPTPGVTDMRFVLSGRELHYFNQKQEWTPFEWPGQSLENLSHIEWQTEQGGLRTALDSQGRFGLVRLLERAKVTQQDNARYLLTWAPDTSQGIPLKVQLRSEAGGGPLDVLQLRNFTLPIRVFVTGSRSAGSRVSTIGPPPLPASAIAAAKHAAVPLPHGLPGGSPLPDDTMRASAEQASGQRTALGLARAKARPAEPGAAKQTNTPKAAISPLAAMSGRSDSSPRPFGHALGLPADVFVF